MSTYTVHGGHAAQGNAYSGAVGLINESREDRIVKDSLIKWLRIAGVSVTDTTVDSGTSQTDVLEQICTKCNAVLADLNISIHFNSGRNDNAGDLKQGGFEIWATNYTDLKLDVANRIVSNMKSLGFGVHGNPLKISKGLYFLNHTKNPSLLLEICFVDDKDDFNMYKKVGAEAIGKAIAEAIVNHNISEKMEEIKMANVFQDTLTGSDKQLWHPEQVNGKWMFRNKYNGEYLDIAGASGKNCANVQTYAKNNSVAQQFELKQLENGYNPKSVAPFVIIPATNKNARLDIEKASRDNGGNLIIYQNNNGANQKFSIIDTGNGYWCIVNVNSLKALTV